VDKLEIYTVDFQPLGRRTRVPSGTTLLEASQQAGVGLRALCGGTGTCGTCRVRVVEGDVSTPTDTEAEAIAEGLRLACQTRVLGDIRVEVPPTSMTAQQRAQVEGIEQAVELDPDIRSYEVSVDPPSVTDLRADVTRIHDALSEKYGVSIDRFDVSVLQHLSGVVRDRNWKVSAVTRDGEVIAVRTPNVHLLGLAVDIGTTKVAAYIVDLETGETLGSSGMMNPQIAYGEDVMARIAYAMKADGNLDVLQRAIVSELNDQARDICERVGCQATDIVQAVLVGNTCMHHLVLGLPVAQMGLAPYVAALADPYDLKARDIGLKVAPGANVHLLPNIAGFVGADHVSFVLAAGIHDTDKVTIGLDIGTNTEISLAANGRLLCCSTASGPAFEGAHIQDGMRAAPGAIEWIQPDGGNVQYQTIDDAAPVGICGSGILDGVAALRQIGVIRPNGAMKANENPRVRRTERGVEYVLVPAGERNAPRDLVITRRDINEIQLAKAAMRAGIEILLLEAGLEDDDIEQFVIAGAFGTYLDVESAVAIGMFPSLPRARFTQVGNAAGTGARLSLLSRACRDKALEIAQRMEYVELTTYPDFTEIYAGALILP